MAFEIYQTTAEHVIGATDAALQKKDGVDENLVAEFLDITSIHALNALCMAEQLSLLKKNRSGRFVPAFPYAVYLITSAPEHKAAILRFVLEQYLPYKTFKFRLAQRVLTPEAANQTRALHEIRAHRDVILWTFTNLGTYANSLVSEGVGRFRPAEGEGIDYLVVTEQVVQDRETAELHVRHRIGSEAANWVDAEHVLSHLVTAYQRLPTVDDDQRAPILHAGNAVESFLSQVAAHHGVNVENAPGINAKADRLAQANHLTKKHQHTLKYLGHVRNASDHGMDPETSHVWEILESTAIEYVHVAQSVIAGIVAYINGRFVI